MTRRAAGLMVVAALAGVLVGTPGRAQDAGGSLEPTVTTTALFTLLSGLDAPVTEPTSTETRTFTPPAIEGCEELAAVLEQAATSADDVRGVRYSFGLDIVEQTVWHFGGQDAEGVIDGLRSRDLDACSRASAERAAPDSEFVLESFDGFTRRPMPVETSFASAAQLTFPDETKQDFVTFWSVRDGYVSRIATQWSDVNVVDDRGRLRRGGVQRAFADFAEAASDQLWVAGGSMLAAATRYQPDGMAPVTALTGRAFFVDQQPELSRARLPVLEACDLERADRLAAMGAGRASATLEASVRQDVVAQDVFWFERVRDARRYERLVQRGFVDGCVELDGAEPVSLSDEQLAEIGVFRAVAFEAAGVSSYVLLARSGSAVLDLRILVAGVVLDHVVLAALISDWIELAEAQAAGRLT